MSSAQPIVPAANSGYPVKSYHEGERSNAVVRMRCSGAARVITAACKPCRCTGAWKQSHLWHNYRPLQRKMEEIIMSLVKDMRDAATIIVTSTVSILKFVENEGIPLCKDQFLRMISVAVCVNAKFWDDEQAGRLLNARIASASSIPLDEFNCMELSFMRGLNWELHISNEDFCSWVSQLEATSDDQKLEAARRNPSPHSSTDLVDMISDFGLASFSSTSSAPQELKAEGLQESILGATAST